MNFPIRTTSILLICVLTLSLGSCTKIKSKSDQNSDEDSVTGDSGNKNDSTWDNTDSAKSVDSSKIEEDFVQGNSGNEVVSTPNNTDSGVTLDASTTDSIKTDSETGTEEINCGSGELLCDSSCVPNNKTNCGECGHDYTVLAHVTGSVECEDGKCILTSSSCESGWADCNDDSEDGCETNITEAKNCGGCGIDCSETAKPLCAPIEGDDGYECAADCSLSAPTSCGDSCVNTEDNPLHCGECDKECASFPNSTPICKDSKCGFKCNDDSHLKCPDGCFPNDDKNCGTCGNDCTEDNEICDGDGQCVECLNDDDCVYSGLEYCVDRECKQCDTNRSNSCRYGRALVYF